MTDKDRAAGSSTESETAGGVSQNAPNPQKTGSDPTGKPKKGRNGPRGPELADHKGLLRLAGSWLRLAHVQWKGEPVSPERLRAMLYGAQIMQSIMNGRETEEARDQMDELRKMLREAGVQVGNA